MALWTFEQNVGVGDWAGYPLDCYDYQNTFGTKNGKVKSVKDISQKDLVVVVNAVESI